MNKYMFFMIAGMLTCSFFTCKTPLLDRGLDFTIINTLDDKITWYIPTAEFQFSNIDLPSEKPSLHRFIPPGGQYGEFLQVIDEEDFYDTLPTDTLHIFILNFNVYRDTNWDTIVINNRIIDRIRLTEVDFENQNYIITVD